MIWVDLTYANLSLKLYEQTVGKATKFWRLTSDTWPANQLDRIFDELTTTCTSISIRLPPTLLSRQTYLRSMATTSPISRLVSRPQAAQFLLRQQQAQLPRPSLTSTSQFHTSTQRNALPSGAPPKNFRLPKPKRYDEGQSALDKAGNYFLLTEIFRGMYVVMEQFFRPPYVTCLSFSLRSRPLSAAQIYDLLPLRKRPYITPLPRRARPETLSIWRGTLHRLQAL